MEVMGIYVWQCVAVLLYDCICARWLWYIYIYIYLHISGRKCGFGVIRGLASLAPITVTIMVRVQMVV